MFCVRPHCDASLCRRQCLPIPELAAPKAPLLTASASASRALQHVQLTRKTDIQAQLCFSEQAGVRADLGAPGMFKGAQHILGDPGRIAEACGKSIDLRRDDLHDRRGVASHHQAASA